MRRCFDGYEGTRCQDVRDSFVFGMAQEYISSSSASESASASEELAKLSEAVGRVMNGTSGLVAGNPTRATSELPAVTDRETAAQSSQSEAQTAARPAEGVQLTGTTGAEGGSAAVEDRRTTGAEESVGDETLGGGTGGGSGSRGF